MREGRIRQAAEIDDIGAGVLHRLGALQDLFDGERRRIGDLAEDAHVVPREVVRAPAKAEIGRKIDKFVGAAFDRNAEFGAQSREIRAAAARQDDTIGLDRAGQTIENDRFGHERRDFDADVGDPPREGGRGEAIENFLQARLRQMSGQEKEALSHGRRAGCGTAPARHDIRRDAGLRPCSNYRPHEGSRKPHVQAGRAAACEKRAGVGQSRRAGNENFGSAPGGEIAEQRIDDAGCYEIPCERLGACVGVGALDQQHARRADFVGQPSGETI